MRGAKNARLTVWISAALVTLSTLAALTSCGAAPTAAPPQPQPAATSIAQPTMPLPPTSTPVPPTATAAPTDTPVPPTVTSSPTNTLVPPTATNTGTPTAVPDTEVVFTDDFSGRCQLTSVDDDQRTFGCVNGEYSMTGKTAPSRRWVYYGKSYGDIVLEADVRMEEGSGFLYSGLAFRVSSDGNDYNGFVISRDGKYYLYRYSRPNSVDLTFAMPSSAIKTGAAAVNHLKLIAQGGQIAIYVNNTWLTTVTDDTYQGGRVGVILWHEQAAKALFDNLRVTQINHPMDLPKPQPTARPTAIPARPTPTAIATVVNPYPLPAGKGGLVIRNYIGEKLTFTIANQQYSVPASPGGGVPGEVFIVLAPNKYTFSANLPAGDVSDEVTVELGKVLILPFALR